MASPQNLCSLSCELTIIRAKNIETKSNKHLFVRCYLHAGNNTRVRLNTQEISSKSNLFWNQSFSLDCFGTQASMHKLLQGTVVFELRQRTTGQILGKFRGSCLLGRAEIPWKSVFEETGIEKWVVMGGKSGRVHGDGKPPAVQVAVKVEVPAVEVAVPRRRLRGEKKWEECGCGERGCCWGDCEFFALAAALEGF
ncbi:Rabphilin-1 like [Actinidia chinensis var. chinensis]|uniref:Rabphilin-1 like n=1 Tax=Actinidia chinensis var. chinensis TaxID=1590841 RepID=A0A2R6S346_ACTCC|nr:Rabphilin-1 like [Actinidia chinensis var. chinensis]